MNTRDLLILKYLKEFKNITKTANALFISQPALTTRIKQLEIEFNTILVHRDNKGAFLTPTGIELLKFSEIALHELDQLKDRIRSIDDAEAGHIKIAAPNIISLYYLPQLIKNFKILYPKVKFSITMAPSSQVSKLMHKDSCHFGFLRDDFGWDKGEKKLLNVNYISIVSTLPFEIKDLVHMKRVDYTTDTYYQKMLDLWWRNTFNCEPKIDIMVNSLDLCKEMVYSGLGFGILPSVFLPEIPTAYHYILKDPQNKPIERKTWFIYKKELLTNQILIEFKNFVENHNFSNFLNLRGQKTE
ncbi:LysR family transcriptional regulator [Veillonella sp. R32]|uniref:LysR family transcriptional regulator n=1 Tax=Veillonella sp. R32 TaxID=2021312 RepID=UPI00138A653F|nr:LysR family transcriptional regulator [Veillonella sp. R32]KAF1682062.1 LysR family transcriptional regulator [Veillonella sp. R32]